MAGLVFRVCMGGPNISGVQISHDRLGGVRTELEASGVITAS